MHARRPLGRLDRPPRRGVLKRVFVTVVVLGVALAAVVAGALRATPWLVERSFETFAAGAPGRAAAATDVRFDPRSLTLELYGFELRDPAVGIAVTAPFARLDFDWRGFVGLGPRSFERIAIERPRLETRSLAELLATAAELARGPLAGLRIGALEIDAGELAIAPPDAEPYGLVAVDAALTSFDASRGADGDAPGRIAVTAATTGGAEVELDGAVRGLARVAGRLGVRGHTLTAVPPWLGTAPVAELHATLDLDGDYVLTQPLSAARFAMDAARITLADVGVAARNGLGARAERLAGEAALAIAAADGGRAVGSARLDFTDANLELSDGNMTPSQTFAFARATISAALDPAAGEASLELTGRLAGSGDVTLQLASAGARDSSVKLAATALPAAIVSPYAAVALGQELAAGAYDLALDYRESAGRVAGDVRVGASGATFAGAALPPGPRAYALELAVALLENADGVAELAATFAGDANDVRGQIGAALEERIAALAAAPFGALAPLADGRSADALQSVSFAPGDTELGPQAQATVDALAGALAQRPRLGVRVHGAADPTADRLALARSQIELHVTLATAGAVFQARPEPVDFASPRAQDILDEFAGERLPPERVMAIARSFNCGENPPPACRTAYYSAIFDALADNEPIPESTVTRLGRFRAQAVAEAFEERGIAAERIAVVAGATRASAGVDGVGLPLELFPHSRL